jgi:hypothetical protein
LDRYDNELELAFAVQSSPSEESQGRICTILLPSIVSAYAIINICGV